MNLIKVPYPKASLSTYAKVLGAVAFTVVFILVVFEPFGTSGFVHDYKLLILAGYGIVIFVVGVVYYLMTDILLPDRVKDRWSVLHEVVFLFSSLMASLVGCYLYWVSVFGSNVSFSQLVTFIMYASTVAVLPVSVYLLFIYQRYKEVIYSTNVVHSQTKDEEVILHGTNKNEQIVVDTDTLLFVKSNDNYVILYILENDRLSRKMLRNTLSQIVQQLGDDFIKVHRQYLVNRSHIISMQGNVTNSILSIKGIDKKIPVSRTMVPKLRDIS